jgi:hypothetical protein
MFAALLSLSRVHFVSAQRKRAGADHERQRGQFHLSSVLRLPGLGQIGLRIVPVPRLYWLEPA